MKVGHWLFRKLLLCQKKKKITLITAGSIDNSVDIVLFGVFFPKGINSA